MIDPAALDELAYNHHWHGDEQITHRDLKEYGMEDDVDELVEQIGYIIAMWRDTLNNIKKIQKEMIE